MEKYKETIAENPLVEMIHISLDSSEDEAEVWAVKESFPWLTVLPDKKKRSGLEPYKTTNSVPEYHLIDSEGNTVISGSAGSAAAFKKIKEISTQS